MMKSRMSEILERSLADAITNQDYNLVKYLLKDLKADPSKILTNLGIAPIHYACGLGSEEFAIKTVKLCLECGADINLGTIEKMTPVLISAFWGREKLLKFLLSNGGDPWINDDEGKDAFEYCDERGNLGCLRILDNFALCVYRDVTALEKKPRPSSSGHGGSEETVEREGDLNPVDYLVQNHLMKMDVYQTNDSAGPGTNESSSSAGPETTTGSFSNPSGNNLPCNVPRETQSALHIDELCSFQDLSISQLSRQDSEPLPSTSSFSDIEPNVAGHQFYTSTARNSFKSPESRKLESNQTTSEETSSWVLPFLSVFDDKFVDLSRLAENQPPNIRSENCICHSQRSSFVSLVDEAIYEGPVDTKVKLLERHIKPQCPFCMRNSRLDQENISEDHSTQSLGSVGSSISTAGTVDTDLLRSQLSEFGLANGPITKTTKKVYVRVLKRNAKKGPPTRRSSDFLASEMLMRTLEDKFESYLSKWACLETEMIAEMDRGIEGQSKTYFNYLLLDPRITVNLPLVERLENKLESWTTFVKSIFYVGKGRHGRPYQHLYEAINPRNLNPSEKISKIRSIWRDKKGVVCLHVFHSISSPEAFSREAAMINALMLKNLTNQQWGSFFGAIGSWDRKKKSQLGTVLLYRAFKVYLAEGERQLYPADVQ